MYSNTATARCTAQKTMIFTGPHFYLGLIQIALVAAYVLIAVYAAGRNAIADRIVIWFIGAFLLMYKTGEYVTMGKVPVDLSAASYFLFGAVAFVPFRPLKAAASFSAMLSGAVYFFTMILYPETHVAGVQTAAVPAFDLAMAMTNHNMLFLGGLFMCAKYAFPREDYVWVLGWFAFFFAYLQLVTVGYGINYANTSIVQILTGTLVADVLGVPLTAAYYVVYYVVVTGLCVAIITLYSLLNRTYAAKKVDRRPVFLPPLLRMPAYFA